jgi:hypothetical protein
VKTLKLNILFMFTPKLLFIPSPCYGGGSSLQNGSPQTVDGGDDTHQRPVGRLLSNITTAVKLRKIKLVEQTSRMGRATHATCTAAL